MLCGRAREDGEKETQALRVYVSNVETAAAGLVSRVQDLENLLALCKSSKLIAKSQFIHSLPIVNYLSLLHSWHFLIAKTHIRCGRWLPSATAFRQGHDAEQLRGQVATEALMEAQKQATAAAQSIAVARDATMELDKVRNNLTHSIN